MHLAAHPRGDAGAMGRSFRWPWQMELSRNSLLEFPGPSLGEKRRVDRLGVACLIALHEENAAWG